MMKFYKSNLPASFFLLYTLIFFCNNAKAQDAINLTNSIISKSLGTKIEFFTDSNSVFNNTNIVYCKKFEKGNISVPIFISPRYNIWARFTLTNATDKSNFFITINYAYISNLWLYKLDSSNKLELVNHTGNATPYNTRSFDNVNFIFPVSISSSEKQTYYIKVSSPHPIELPISINDEKTETVSYFQQHFIIGIYLGIIISFFLYNAFLFFSTKDKNYLLYIIYLFFLGFAQITFAGWSFKYFWPSQPQLNLYAVVVTSSLAGITGVAFGKSFLNSAHFTPRLNKVLSGLIALYAVSVVLIFLKQSYISYSILNINSSLVGVFLLVTALVILKTGYRPAYFYFFAWAFFLLGLIVFALRNMGIIPTNDFTHSILYLGSALEAILLSIALADRINILKRETIVLQAKALETSQENERLVKEQNVILEQKVDQRTHELQESNIQLSVALDNLKDAQTQLVEAEKMASLGQLTAGIAHEINNPINFVKSNINPLRLDVRDLLDVLNEYEGLHKINEEATYKKKLTEIEKFKQQIDVDFVQKEIDSLIVGIEEGAERTAEIVQGLRTFSRIDEAELKTVNIHDGILSTLVILKNSTPYYITVEKEFNAQGEIECFPGKLNQVFMNVITNAIQAIAAKPEKINPETISIITKDVDNDRTQISIKDTGIGMTEEVKHRIFEPFFTTKDVGEGTGLGMAIVFKIIQKHEGHVDILSEPCKGSEFIITLPNKHPISDHL
jgi:signal transduction histidine kinase